MGLSCWGSAAAGTSLGITLVLMHLEVALSCTPSAPLPAPQPQSSPSRSPVQPSPRGSLFSSPSSTACSPGTRWVLPEQKHPAEFPAWFPPGTELGRSVDLSGAQLTPSPQPCFCRGEDQERSACSWTPSFSSTHLLCHLWFLLSCVSFPALGTV